MLSEMSETAATDLQLLARYTRDHAEDAFAELARRHVDLVHSAALRQVRSPQLAEEVAQSVFTDLARNAHRLAPDTIVTAWLYQVTRRTAIDVVRKESRRQLREQIATEMNAMNATTADWTHIEPLLDEAMSALDETDRAAVLLRYFENKSLREVGATLGTSDDAAQKRVSRAVERLREFFTKRGVTVGASGLVVVISANAVQAAPLGLAVTISTAAALAGTITTATIATHTTMNWLTTKTLSAIVAAAITAGTGTYLVQQKESNRLRGENETLATANQALTIERDTALSASTGNNDELERLRKEKNELLRLRGEVGLLRKQTSELANLKAENLRLRAAASSLQINQPPQTPATAQTKFPKEAWAFAGYATPEAALQTWTWAMNKGDKQTMLASLNPEARAHWEKLLANQTDAQIAAEATKGSSKLEGYQITGRTSRSDTEVDLAITITTTDGPTTRTTEEQKYKLVKMGDDWKMAGQASE